MKPKEQVLACKVRVFQAEISLEHPSKLGYVNFSSIEDAKIFHRKLGELIKGAESSVSSMISEARKKP